MHSKNIMYWYIIEMSKLQNVSEKCLNNAVNTLASSHTYLFSICNVIATPNYDMLMKHTEFEDVFQNNT
jgi:hypothetical protein